MVLVYHRIAPSGTAHGGVTVSREHFEEHVEAARTHFRPLALAELTRRLADGAIPSRSVVFTFDDGYVDNLAEAKPVLERHDVPATVFVVSGYVGSGRRFWWDELERACDAPGLPDRLALNIGGAVRTWEVADGRRRDLFRSLRGAFGRLEDCERDELLARLGTLAGFAPTGSVETLTADELLQLADGGLIEIGAHTVTHPCLAGLPRKRQLAEIAESRRQLEAILSREVRLFSYPFGSYGRTTAACAQRAGLTCACTIEGGGVGVSTNRFRLPRVHVDDWPADELIERVAAYLDVWATCG